MGVKKVIGLILGIAALGLQIPGLIMIFSNTGGWNAAAVILAVLMAATAILAALSAIFSAIGQKKAAALFVWAGAAGALSLALTFYLQLAFEFTIIAQAISVIMLFVASRVVSPKNPDIP